jgi:acyl-CoA reductase-like NAD-dependent aldehyde dehydrogenase
MSTRSADASAGAAMLTCVSPRTGEPFVQRPAQSRGELDAVVTAARHAQRAWRQVPLSERVAAVNAMVDALTAMNDEIVVELAHMMGRPVRYGGEIGGVQERALHMTGIAEASLAPIVIEDSPHFRRYMTVIEPSGHSSASSIDQ